MRASFLLVLALALLVGLGVAVAVKTTGILNPPEKVVAEAPPAPPSAPPPTVVVAARNLYDTDTIRPGDVVTRPVSADQMKEYEATKAELLPVLDAAFYRFPAKEVVAGTVLKLSDLKPMKKPEPLVDRIAPGSRAVNVSITKNESAGGLIAVGDWVDVVVTTEVGRTDSEIRQSRTAVIARGAQVVAKRDTLWSVFAPLAPEEEIKYTLSTNTYRAALIDYAKTIGSMTLVPVSSSESKGYETRLAKVKAEPATALTLTHPDTASVEYKAEARKLAEYATGTMAVGTEDLLEVFALNPLPAPPRPQTVEVFNGAARQQPLVFVSTDSAAGTGQAPAYTFHAPAKPKPVTEDSSDKLPPNVVRLRQPSRVLTVPGTASLPPSALPPGTSVTPPQTGR